MNKLIKILPLLATGVALVGCQDEDFGFDAKDIKYETEFRKAFGKIDPNQDWNAATRSEVTVSTSSVSNIKIYALVDGEYSIVGDYTDISGTQTLGFDCRKGVTEIMVTDGRMGQKTVVGGSVSFGVISRAANYGDNLSGTDISVSTTGRYINISKEESKAYADVIPEINKNTKPYNETNLPKVTKNFKYISNGRFSFYPMYWDTGGSDQIGIYYTDENGVEKEVIIYTPKSGDEFQNLTSYNLSINPTPADAINQSTVTEEDYLNAIDQSTSYELTFDNLNGNYVIKNSGNTYIYTTGNFTPGDGSSNTAHITCYKAENVTSTPSTAAYGWGTPAATQRSKEIVVDIPEGVEFGFFLVNGSYKFYSDASKNINYPSRSGFPSGKASYAASIHINGEQYFCFEDWADGDFDLNDLVFRFADPAPTVVDNDAVNSTWDVLCEDLGSTFDTDFNDIVIRVEYVSGRTTATVTPLAAGGTLADYLFFEGPNLGEIHQMFGAAPAVSGQYDPINVDDERGTSGKQMAITVPTDWSMASYQADKWDTDTQISGKNMGGFQVFVLPQGAAADADNFGNASVIAAPAVGQIPEMICVPDQYSVIEERSGTQYKTKYYFSWAKELKSLSIAFNETDHKYSSWISDYSSNNDWFKYPSGNIVERKQISSVVYDPATDSGEEPTDPEEEPLYDSEEAARRLAEYGTIVNVDLGGSISIPSTVFTEEATSVIITLFTDGGVKNKMSSNYAVNGSTHYTGNDAYDSQTFTGADLSWLKSNGLTIMDNYYSGDYKYTYDPITEIRIKCVEEGEDSGEGGSTTSYGTPLTLASTGSMWDGGYEIYAIFSTEGLPTEGNVIITMEVDKSAGYFNQNNKGLFGSSDGTSFTQISSAEYKCDQNSIAQFTVAASEYKNYTSLRFNIDAGSGASITKGSFKSAD